MTNQEIVRGFTLELDKVSSYSLPELSLAEKLYFINKAITKVVDRKYNGFNKSKKGFEESEFKRSELKQLVKTSTALVTATINGDYNTKIKYSHYNLPADYNYYLRNSIKFKYLKRSCNTLSDFISTYFTIDNLDDLDKVLNDPFNTPVKSEIVASVEDNKLKIYYDSTCVLGDIILVYLKQPIIIIASNSTVYADLPDKVLYEVIADAVDFALEPLESPRLQSHQIEMSKNE